MNKSDLVQLILKNKLNQPPKQKSATAFAPSNIALVKYWGKRDEELNLPMTSSLSMSLKEKGAEVTLTASNLPQDHVLLNDKDISVDSDFYKRLVSFLNLFRAQHKQHFFIKIKSTVPIAAGLASSACGFASLVLALNKLYDWQLSDIGLSILARLGSGSACRSIWQGFVEWQAGKRDDGLDSHGELLNFEWPELRLGILMISNAEKNISSRTAMKQTVATSPLYSAWPQKVADDLVAVKKALAEKDFDLLGKTAESNAMTMHATMQSAWPPIVYAVPDTIMAMNDIWYMRAQGLPVYFTQDAGPNLKLLFLQKDENAIKEHFSFIEVI